MQVAPVTGLNPKWAFSEVVGVIMEKSIVELFVRTVTLLQYYLMVAKLGVNQNPGGILAKARTSRSSS